MITFSGTSVFGGVAFGKISFWKKTQNLVKRARIEDTESEVIRYEKANETAVLQLKSLHQKALAEVGEANALIFEIHTMMLEDGDYQDSIRSMITTQNVNAEYAVANTGDNFSRMFSEMDDDYMRERAADVKDVSERLVRVLSGINDHYVTSDEPVILATDDLTPSETVQLDKEKILAFITAEGSTNSHTAILARMMGIPAIVDIGGALKEEYDGKEAIIDGFTGTVYVEPDSVITEKLRKQQQEDKERRELLKSLRGKENQTLDGKTVEVFANIGNVGDVAAALKNDAGGVGLFRSEFLYLESSDYPTEIEQLAAYKLVAENMAGHKVIIRTLDIGADKQIGYFNLPKEENPAMGYRAIRICLDRPDIFKTQLRAIYRASAFGILAIMFPMITAVEEIHEIKQMIQIVKNELEAESIPYAKKLELGVMIETPAAVMISQELAKEVDFFSIGTNDLTQYTLAVDRQNSKIGRFYNPHHKAILRMIKMVTDNAHKEGKWVGICGELAADLALTETFLSIGVDEFSVSPPYVLPLRGRIRECDVSQCALGILGNL